MADGGEEEQGWNLRLWGGANGMVPEILFERKYIGVPGFRINFFSFFYGGVGVVSCMWCM